MSKIDEWYERAESRYGPVMRAHSSIQPHQDADGTANLYYFDKERSLAFHWTGNPEHMVEVSQGGDHEQARWWFDFMAYGAASRSENTYLAATEEFKASCDAWIKKVEEGLLP